MTQLEPAFGGLLQGPSHQPPIDVPTTDQLSAAHTVTDNNGSLLQTSLTCVTGLTGTAGVGSSGVEEQVDEHELGGDSHPAKRLKLSEPSASVSHHDEQKQFPTDQDIDDFLDQLHH